MNLPGTDPAVGPRVAIDDHQESRRWTPKERLARNLYDAFVRGRRERDGERAPSRAWAELPDRDRQQLLSLAAEVIARREARAR